MPTIVGGQQPPAEGEPRGQIRIAVEQFENAEESAVGTQVDVCRLEMVQPVFESTLSLHKSVVVEPQIGRRLPQILGQILKDVGSMAWRDLVAQLGESAELAFIQLMTDVSVPLEERATIWAQVDDMEPLVRLRTWDRIRPWLAREIDGGPLRGRVKVSEAFPEPPGIEAWRARLAQEAVRANQDAEGGEAAGVDRTGDR